MDAPPPTTPEAFVNAGFELARLWSQFSDKISRAGMAAAAGASPATAATQMRGAVFQAMTESTDEFLRSPQFLETMKHSLSQAVEFRRRLNEFLGRIHYELQGASRQDVDQLMEVMNHLERRMGDYFERLTEQLKDVNTRLAALEQATVHPKRKPRGKPRLAKAAR